MFEEYSAHRASVRREMKDGHNHAWTNVLSHYVSLLLDILKEQVLHHSFTLATATLETVAMAFDQVPQIVHVVGVLVLSRGSDEGPYRTTLQLLKHLFTRESKHQISLLVEMALLIASHESLQEAYDTLHSQVHVEPYRSNAMVHGCCAVLKYLLWREVWSGSDKKVWSPCGTSAEKMKTLAKQALQHFEIVVELSPLPSPNMDVLTSVHSKFLVELGKGDEALELLISYRMSAPYRLTASRLVCEHARQHCTVECLLSHLSKVAELDDSSHEALELAGMLCDGVSAMNCDEEYKRVFELLVKYLDYPCNRFQPQPWVLLHKVQSMWPDYETNEVWRRALPWWQYLPEWRQ